MNNLLDDIVTILTSEGTPDSRIQKVLTLLEQARRQEGSTVLDPGRGSPSHQRAATQVQGVHGKPGKGKTKESGPHLIGESMAMDAIYEAIRRVGTSRANVLIRGESGTGKELVAKAIHTTSDRVSRAFVPVHCAAVPDSLIESTLFGYERGAFTGAVQMRRGKVDLASGGTLFLDEVGDIPLGAQVKLLRVIQEREYERVGGATTLSADIRVLAATHRDLEAMVASGTFREDLYYRLNVVPIILPPLRERKEDIPLLVEHFLDRFNRENRRHIQLGRDVMAILAQYHWPGNIRELQNCIERLVVLADSSNVSIANVPKPLRSYIDHINGVTLSSSLKHEKGKSADTLPEHVQNLERERLRQVLEDVAWTKAKAARILGLTPRQVAYKIKKYAIHKDSRVPPPAH